MRNIYMFLALSIFSVITYGQKGLTRFELRPGDRGCNPYDFTAGMGRLFFTASTVDSIGNQLWYVDGDNAPLQLTTYPVPLGYSPIIGAIDNKLYFAVREDHNDLTEKIYVYDGNIPPYLFVDIAPGDTAMKIWDGAVYNGKLYFTAWTKSYEHAIWSLDPVNNQAQVEYIPPNYTNILGLTVLNDKLFFRQSTVMYGNELYSFDLITKKDTVYDINPGSASTFVTDIRLIDGRIYFRGKDPNYGFELFMCDGQNFPVRITDILPGSTDGIYVPSPVGLNGMVYFIGATSIPIDQNAAALYRYDPSIDSVVLEVNLLPTYNTVVQELIVYNNKIYFTAADSTGIGQELAVYDFVNLPHIVADGKNPGSTYPMDFHLYKDYLFFKGSDIYAGWEVFRYIDPALSTETNEVEQNLALYPNPAGEEINLTAKHTKSEMLKIDILDMQGRRIHNERIYISAGSSLTKPISLRALNNGAYFCVVRDERGYTYLKKTFIKEK